MQMSRRQHEYCNSMLVPGRGQKCEIDDIETCVPDELEIEELTFSLIAGSQYLLIVQFSVHTAIRSACIALQSDLSSSIPIQVFEMRNHSPPHLQELRLCYKRAKFGLALR